MRIERRQKVGGVYEELENNECKEGLLQDRSLLNETDFLVMGWSVRTAVLYELWRLLVRKHVLKYVGLGYWSHSL